MRVFTLGHGTRPLEELLDCLVQANVETLVDVRRYPRSRRNPQFNGDTLADAVQTVGVAYRHAEELGGRRSAAPGEEQFGCIAVSAFRSYAARMQTTAWQTALADAIAEPAPCLMCAETPWWRCHRRLIADRLTALGWSVCHIGADGTLARHALPDFAIVAADGTVRYPPAQAALP